MKTVQKKPPEELRMRSADFDRIMGQALQVKPETAKKLKKKAASKPKKSASKRA